MLTFQMSGLNRYVCIILVFKYRNCSLLEEKSVVYVYFHVLGSGLKSGNYREGGFGFFGGKFFQMMWAPCQWTELHCEVVNFYLLQEFKHSWTTTWWECFRILKFWLHALEKLKMLHYIFLKSRESWVYDFR